MNTKQYIFLSITTYTIHLLIAIIPIIILDTSDTSLRIMQIIYFGPLMILAITWGIVGIKNTAINKLNAVFVVCSAFIYFGIQTIIWFQ